MEYFFVGDDIFALHKNLMKPYNRNGPLTQEQKIFNYRISRSRLPIENTFGILTGRWRIFERPLAFNLKTTENIIITAIMLHNFIITQNLLLQDNNEYIDADVPENSDFVDRVDVNVDNLVDMGNCVQQRNILAEYFSSEVGSVYWQYDPIN